MEDQIREFTTQQFPTAEETQKNNASVLYKRKKFFLKDLRHHTEVLGFVMIIMIYLKDISMLRLALRGFCHYTLSNPYPRRYLYTEESKKGLIKFLLISTFAINGFCFAMHLLFGAYKTNPFGDHNYLFGGITVQFIGERLPYGRIELLAFDVMIFIDQIILHNLMCFIDDSVVLQTKPVSINDASDMSERENYNGDGYNGDVNILKMYIIEDIKTIMSYENYFSSVYPESIETEPSISAIPGGFINV